jgi:peptidoglycan/xylan/chitin deacetylase (PgdA/CDA1 family)
MKLGFFVLPFMFAVGMSSCKREEQSTSEETVFWNKTGELRGARFGLGPKEIALTLDDGPSANTLGLAKFLAEKNVPAVFFVNYTNGGNGISQPFGAATLKGICDLKIHSLANHTDFHLLGGKEKATKGRLWENIERTHEAIKAACPAPHYFFRSPGGNWNGEEEALNKNAQLDRDGIPLGEIYVGPVYWDIGGQQPVADWYSNSKDGCQEFIDKCRDGYIAETEKKAGGVMLAHDIHEKTMELLMGKNWKALLKNPKASDGADGLIVRLQKRGYKFVALDKNKAAMKVLIEGASASPQK